MIEKRPPILKTARAEMVKVDEENEPSFYIHSSVSMHRTEEGGENIIMFKVWPRCRYEYHEKEDDLAPFSIFYFGPHNVTNGDMAAVQIYRDLCVKLYPAIVLYAEENGLKLI
jgi:hypothetical protein